MNKNMLAGCLVLFAAIGYGEVIPVRAVAHREIGRAHV